MHFTELQVGQMIEKAIIAERERCASVAYKFAEDADWGHDRETEAGRQARKIGNAIRFSPVQGEEG